MAQKKASIEPETTKPEHAFIRVFNSRIGCFAGEPTVEYLETLIKELGRFSADAQAQLQRLIAEQKKERT